jgi:hypothetical protein
MAIQTWIILRLANGLVCIALDVIHSHQQQISEYACANKTQAKT